MHILTGAETVETSVEAVKGFFGSLTLRTVIPTFLVFLVGLAVVKLLLKLFDRVLTRSKLEKVAFTMLRTGMKVLLYLILMLVVTAQLGIDVSSLIAVLSIVSLAVSLAVQGALSNIVGGIMLVATHPFETGDFVEIGATSGTVEEVGVTYTRLMTPDNKVISIPNSKASNEEITNYSRAGVRRVDFPTAAAYESDMETVKAALLRAAKLDTVLEDPGVFVGVKEYGDHAITYMLQVWTKAENYWPVFYAIQENIHREFDRAGVIMTYPHLNVHVDK